MFPSSFLWRRLTIRLPLAIEIEARVFFLLLISRRRLSLDQLDRPLLPGHRLREVARFSQRSRQRVDYVAVLPRGNVTGFFGECQSAFGIANLGVGAGAQQPCRGVNGHPIIRSLGNGLIVVLESEFV